MAHGVVQTDNVKVHQAVHGYADGHRQLTASVSLKPNDAKTMLVLSDISGAGAQIGDDGYLTGYPLAESGFYALARTWPAPEMSRPGCVWTHTLLIEFADLATLIYPIELLLLFRRPVLGETADYGKAARAPAVSASYANIDPNSVSWCRQVVAHLYGEPKRKIIAARSQGLQADEVVLAIWGQQWPRLRRTFRFCTLAAIDRSTDSYAFDLQLFRSSDRSARNRFANAVDAESLPRDDGLWLEDTISDLCQPDTTGLRGFLRRVGGNVTSGREAFRSLCRLHRLIAEFSDRPESVDGAIDLVTSQLQVSNDSGLQVFVANEALKQAGSLRGPALHYVLKSIDSVDSQLLSEHAEALGRSAWLDAPQHLESMLSDGEVPRRVAERTLSSLHIDELLDGMRRLPSLEHTILRSRNEIVLHPNFWKATNIATDEALEISQRPEFRAEAIAAVTSAGRADLARKATLKFGAFEVLSALANRYDESSESFTDWLAAAVEPFAVARFFAGGHSHSKALLCELASRLAPDQVPNQIGADPWLTAYKSATGTVSRDSELFLDAYLLARALGHSSRNSADLARIGFEPVYRAAWNGQLPDKGWRLMEHRLPSSMWSSWDRCLRIQKGVVELFVDRDLDPFTFASLTSDDWLFSLLVNSARSSYRGRRYISRVRDAVASSNAAARLSSLTTLSDD
jgi:hypothetical protein